MEQLLHPAVTFEFPDALPSRPDVIHGRSNIIDNIAKRKFHYSFHEPLYIESTTKGEVFAEILAEETFNKSNKSYKQHIICKGKLTDGMLSYYKEFFNPITRLQGLLDLNDDNIIILND